MGHLATGEIFEKMLQLNRFGLYFEGVMNRKDYFHIEIMISATEMRCWEVRGHAPRNFSEMIDAVW